MPKGGQGYTDLKTSRYKSLQKGNHIYTWQQKTLLSSSFTRLRKIRERADMGAQTPATSKSLQKEIQKNQREIQ